MVLIGFNTCFGQSLLAKIEVPFKIEGLCNQDEYYHLMNSLGEQTVAACPQTLADKLVMELKLQEDFPKFKGSDGVNVSINCRGEVVLVEANFENDELNQRIRDIFTSLGEWEAGSFRGKKVDSSVLYAIKIKKGELELNRNIWKE